MLSLRVALPLSAPVRYRCVGCTAASVQPGTVPATFSCLRLQRVRHRRQRLASGFLWPSASALIASYPEAQSNTLLV